MKYVFLSVVMFFSSLLLMSQNKAELEAQRKKTLEEIIYVDNLLKTTAKERTESMNEVRIIGKKLSLRESIIAGMRDDFAS
jgi:hypothetical protein